MIGAIAMLVRAYRVWKSGGRWQLWQGGGLVPARVLHHHAVQFGTRAVRVEHRIAPSTAGRIRALTPQGAKRVLRCHPRRFARPPGSVRAGRVVPGSVVAGHRIERVLHESGIGITCRAVPITSTSPRSRHAGGRNRSSSPWSTRPPLPQIPPGFAAGSPAPMNRLPASDIPRSPESSGTVCPTASCGSPPHRFPPPTPPS